MQLSWTNRLYHFLKGPNPLHPKVWKDRLSPITFRRFAPEDTPQCLEIYRLNEPGRFPAGVIDQYQISLASKRTYVLVAEKQGRVVASGGLYYCVRKNVAVLSFGLVHPEFQGRGVGTSLVLARLGLLNPAEDSFHVFLFAVEKSVGFYRRLGFAPFAPWVDKTGKAHPSGCLILTGPEIRTCRDLLVRHGIQIPADESLVPLLTKRDFSA